MQEESKYNDKEILIRIADGDEYAFQQFYERYSSLMYPFLKKYTTSDNEIYEVVQETFIKVWLHRDKLPEIQHIKSWLYKIAARTFLNQLAKESSEKERIRHFGTASTLHEAVTPLQQMHARELKSAIRTAVNSLPHQQRRIFILSRNEGLKPSEIASQLNMPLSTVKNQLSAALKEIRHYLVQSGYGPVAIIHILIKIF